MIAPLTLSAQEAAERAGVSVKILRAAVGARHLRYVLLGKRKRFTLEDITAWIEAQKRVAPCPSTKDRGRRTGNTTSGSAVFDFAALRARKTGERRNSV